MTTLLLIRHASCDPLGHFIAGRKAGIHLNAAGRAQAETLAATLAATPLDAIYSSPLERARETAEAVARGRGLTVTLLDKLLELDFGRWTGCTLEELRSDPAWMSWHTARDITRIPGGESMLDVQQRSMVAVEMIREQWPQATCAVVSHGDVIRGLIAHLLGIPISLMLRFQVAPASVSVVRITADSAEVMCLNRLPELSFD